MLLQKRTSFERCRRVDEHDQLQAARDTLFERDWDVFVVKRDPETGEFVTATVETEEPETVA